MRVAGVQIAVSTETREKNIEKAVYWIREAAQKGARIVCLQEFFATGSFTWKRDPAYFKWAESVTGPTVNTMSSLAEELGIWLIAPIFERDEIKGRYYNTAVLINAEGKIAGKYRKQFVPLNINTNEKYYFAPGNLGSPVFKVEDLKIGIILCFDRHFFEIHRIMALKGADVIFVPTSTINAPGRVNVWEAELISIAANNGVYVVGVNSTGNAENKPQFGISIIVDPIGTTIVKLGEEEGIVMADLSPEYVAEARVRYFITRDYRPELLEELLQLYKS